MSDVWEDVDFEDKEESGDKYVSFNYYKGKKLLCLKTDWDIKNRKYGFQFGQAKARLIVKYFDLIKKFAKEEIERGE